LKLGFGIGIVVRVIGEIGSGEWESVGERWSGNRVEAMREGVKIGIGDFRMRFWDFVSSFRLGLMLMKLFPML